jgi:hypothetical protein
MPNHFGQSGCGAIAEAKLPLFDKPIPKQNFTEYTCESYDLEHPQIWKDFVNVAIKQIQMGYTHLGAKAICEIIRFNSPSGSEYPKVNNNMTAYYARKFIKTFPMYEDFFETRKSKRDKEE